MLGNNFVSTADERRRTKRRAEQALDSHGDSSHRCRIMAAPFRIYNSLSRSVEDFTPQKEGHLGLYVCGMTVYDHIHVGHARAMVVFDSFVLYLRHRGWDVHFVRNFTDVDDKIIARAAKTGEEPIALAQRYIDAFHTDVAALGLMEPDAEPRVSTSIDAILSLISNLMDREHAYVQDGTVWFSVRSFDDYGKLSGQKLDELRSADDASGKREPADFALWKASKPGEPSWDSPWGPGRPGWHSSEPSRCRPRPHQASDLCCWQCRQLLVRRIDRKAQDIPWHQLF